MKEYVEVNATREFAHGLFPDPNLRLAINAVLAQAPRANVVEADRGNSPAPASAGMVSWLRDKADRSGDLTWSRMMRRIADRLLALERMNKWIPAGNPPEEGLVVLVTDGKYVDTGMYDAEDQSFSVDHGFLYPDDVLGWKSLSSLQEVL